MALLIRRHTHPLLAHWLRKGFRMGLLNRIGGGIFSIVKYPNSRQTSHFIKSIATTSMLCMALLCTALFASCEKALDKPKDEGHPILYGYYLESKGLNKDAVDIDSVCRFSDKVYDYVYFYPDCVSTTYFSRIEYNISQRLGDLGITFEGSRWDGTTVIDFNFGGEDDDENEDNQE